MGAGAFHTADCQKTYEELKAKGVEFMHPPTDRFYGIGALMGRSPAEILERTGWARSVGGAAPYLTLFARGGISRETADAVVEKLEIHELPAARNCTYVLPATDFALGLTVGAGLAGAEMKVALKLRV